MNVKKTSIRKFDKENSFDDLNRNHGHLQHPKKSSKTGEQIRRRMKLISINTENVPKNTHESRGLRINTNFTNRLDNKSHNRFEKSFNDTSRLRRSTEYFSGLSTSRSTKSVKFQEKFDDPNLSRKHRASSILKSSSSLKKSPLQSSKASIKSSICSYIGQQQQSIQSTNLNKTMKQKYEKLSENLQKTETKYSDQLYPPLPSSLYHKHNSSLCNGTIQNKRVVWIRLSEYFYGKHITVYSRNRQQNPVVIRNNPNFPEFVNQALVFNAIKNNNFLLEKMFEISAYNQNGIYLVKINQNNQWKYMIVDDYVPVITSNQNKQKKYNGSDSKNSRYEMAFLSYERNNSQNSEVEIWPYLLQKAYAKYYGTYESLMKADVVDHLQELTSCPIEKVDVNASTFDKISEQIQNYDTIMLAQNKHNEYFPIIPFKSQITIQNIQQNELTAYTPQNFIAQFSNVYCICLHKYFYTGACLIRQTMKMLEIEKQKKAEQVSLRYFKIEDATDCVISVLQKDAKHYYHSSNDYKYCWIRLIVAQKQSESNYRWVGGAYQNTKSVGIKAQLEPGEYYVLVIPEWNKKAYDLNLIFSGNSTCQLQRKSYIGNQSILTQAAMDLAQRSGRVKQLNQNICTYTYISRDLGFIIENINNERPHGHIRILRSIEGLQKNKKSIIKAFNKQFKHEHTIEVKIQSLKHYTVVLGVLGGVNQAFLDQFDFGS